MPLTTAIITIVALDIAVLALLAYVMRAPFRRVAVARAQTAEPARAVQPRRRYVAGQARPQHATSAVR